MKIRSTFVSNSSSSSFILRKKNLLGWIKKNLVTNLEGLGELYNMEYSSDSHSWRIKQDKYYIYGDTLMDNFNMPELFSNLQLSSDDYKIESDGGSHGNLEYTFDSNFFKKFCKKIHPAYSEQPTTDEWVMDVGKWISVTTSNGCGAFIGRNHPTINYGQTFDFVDFVDLNNKIAGINLHGYSIDDEYVVVDVNDIVLFNYTSTHQYSDNQ